MREHLGGHLAASQGQPTTRARSDKGRSVLLLQSPAKTVCHPAPSAPGLQAGALAPALAFPTCPLVWLQQPTG